MATEEMVLVTFSCPEVGNVIREIDGTRKRVEAIKSFTGTVAVLIVCEVVE